MDEVDPSANILYASRSRKRPQHYDASVSSTEYTRTLRVREAEEERLRKSCVAVRFVDGVTRAVRLEMSDRGRSWVHAGDWAAHAGALRRSVPLANKGGGKGSPLVAGRVLLFRVDGKGWRRIRLVRGVRARGPGARAGRGLPVPFFSFWPWLVLK